MKKENVIWEAIWFFCPKFQSYLDPLRKISIVKVEDSKKKYHEKVENIAKEERSETMVLFYLTDKKDCHEKNKNQMSSFCL